MVSEADSRNYFDYCHSCRTHLSLNKDLNAQRTAEEAKGHIRWLRPEYQAPESSQVSADLITEAVEKGAVAAPQGKQAWPKTMPEQVGIIRTVLAKGPQTLEALATQFKRKPVKGVEQVLAALQVLGHAEFSNELWQLRQEKVIVCRSVLQIIHPGQSLPWRTGATQS